MDLLGRAPLLDDESTECIERDARLLTRARMRFTAVLSVYGGKITTYRRWQRKQWIAWLRCSDIARRRGHARPLCRVATCRVTTSRRSARSLRAGVRGWITGCCGAIRGLRPRVERVLGTADSMLDLGAEVLPGLHVREIEYLRREEGLSARGHPVPAQQARLHLPMEASDQLAGWLAGHPADAAAAARA